MTETRKHLTVTSLLITLRTGDKAGSLVWAEDAPKRARPRPRKWTLP